MQFNLVPHPAKPPTDPSWKFWVNVDRSASFGADATLNMFFCVGAPASDFVIPASQEPQRANGLWQTTCFEAFLRPIGGEEYREWNFVPSGDWAAYDFSAYREGMRDATIAAPPYIRMEDNLTWWTVGATIAVPAGQEFAFGLAAVLEEESGQKSYWALAHPDGPPDFHHRDCFAAKLP